MVDTLCCNKRTEQYICSTSTILLKFDFCVSISATYPLDFPLCLPPVLRCILHFSTCPNCCSQNNLRPYSVSYYKYLLHFTKYLVTITYLKRKSLNEHLVITQYKVIFKYNIIISYLSSRLIVVIMEFVLLL